jgi:hypothetical protein
MGHKPGTNSLGFPWSGPQPVPRSISTKMPPEFFVISLDAGMPLGVSKVSKLASKWPSGRRNLLNGRKRTWTSEMGLVLWQGFRRELLEGRAHRRSLGYPRISCQGQWRR